MHSIDDLQHRTNTRLYFPFPRRTHGAHISVTQIGQTPNLKIQATADADGVRLLRQPSQSFHFGRTRLNRSLVEKGNPLDVHLAACIAISAEWIMSGGSFGGVSPKELLLSLIHI